MSLRQIYERFLANPSPEALAPGASISYIPTLTTINESAAILKHLAAQQKQLTKKSEKILSAVEGGGSLCVDVDVTIEFVLGGGTILPGLDDNFLADRTVFFPMIHMVKFDSQQKIKQIRLHWDQGSLLKQVEVIGSRGRNWPLRDGKEQIRLITSLASVSSEVSQSTTSGQEIPTEGEDVPARGRAQSGKSATGDPHATLSLFQPRDPNEQPSTPRANAVISPRASAKPAPRDLSDLFAGETAGASPSKRNGDVQAKGGASKNFQPIRLFERGEEEETQTKSPERLKTNPKKYHHFEFDDGAGDNAEASRADYFEFSKNHYAGKVKTNPKKYDHFELGDGEDASFQQKKSPSKQHEVAKHQPNWSFEDFATPQQVKNKLRPHDMRQFGWSDDEEQSPVRRPIVHQARPDAEPHFEFRDDNTPDAAKNSNKFRGRSHKNGLGLYNDPVLGGDAEIDQTSTKGSDEPRQAGGGGGGGGGAAGRAADHLKTFGSQFDMTDSSPAARNKTGAGSDAGATKLRENQKKILKGLDASWDMYEDRPEQRGQEDGRVAYGGVRKENESGMGGQKNGKPAPRIRKDTQPSWGFGGGGGEEDEEGS